MACEWEGGVCVTRRRLKQAVADATGNGWRWRGAIRQLTAHHCERRPDPKLFEAIRETHEECVIAALTLGRLESGSAEIHEFIAKTKEFYKAVYAVEYST